MRELLEPFVLWSDGLAPAAWVRNGTWVFPMLEVCHLFGLILLFGSAGMFALRGCGLVLRKDSMVRTARLMAPLSFAGAAIMIATGYLMFASAATKYADNEAFQYKMLLLLIAVIAHALTYARVVRMRHDGQPALWLLISSVILLLWVSVGVAGRAIAFL